MLWFFFKVTLERPETTRHLVFVYEPRKLPIIGLQQRELHQAELSAAAADAFEFACNRSSASIAAEKSPRSKAEGARHRRDGGA